MIYILISICCSITVAVLLKLARRYQINIVQAVTWNYLVAIALSFAFFKPQAKDLLQSPAPVYVILGLLLPLVFWFLAASIKNLGIVKTDIAQRLSLFLPILAAYFIFKEELNTWKVLGLAIGLVAILLTLIKHSKQQTSSTKWIYALVVFIGFGVIDILFKQVALIKTIPYTSSLIVVFGVAFLLAMAYMVFIAYKQHQRITLINFLCGAILGVFNFGNILFYLKAHQALSNNPSTVFAAMNMGVITLGSLVGVVIFKEKLSKINYIGLALALLAILCITLSQRHVI